ncbi:hypothetical protein TraAM80_04574 [Trypanosoma rangeli]|uniref:Conserved oligomeric Golgi complex subunit 7 n=1 Tax=Trypanosoma rangeli TaxID=5698 RepID=A0A422NIU2_TRYRA|nr:uncharacterized protein TraAM80_04574 [Trypanosoma rangeli]RNF05375.1 hypothetical protein TraAM80_04574 [Trypanosoma rangeli]|eukprot:RNF05375.1 hypothetical protein TraAM80_04574 [Trypanosoma rangeli]
MEAVNAAEAVELRLDQLSAEHVDIKRWINTSLQGLLAVEATTAEGDTEVEAGVMKLFNRLQTHLQEVSGSVEDTIAQALVRLPRTGLEVGRMVTEAQQLQSQLQSMQEVAQSAVEAAAKPYVARLNALKKTQEKLARCSDTLWKATQVDSHMKQLDDVIQQLRISPSEVDMDAVAESISQVQGNLAELQKLDVTFGEKQLETVERYEQVVQHAVEAECMDMLRRCEVDRAAQLLKVLDTISRADAVLQQYAVESMASEKERVERMLLGGGSATAMPPARAAELLKGQLMPSIGHTLSDQLDYVLRMAQSEDRATADPLQTEKHAEALHEVEVRAVKVMQLMVDEVVGSIGGALEPILERAERNEEVMACCDAVRQLGLREDVGIHTTGAESAIGCGGSLQEEIVRQIATYAFTELIGIFGKPNILEAFAQREACRVEALLDDPKQALRRERFQLVMDAMMDGVKSIVRFFPEKTLPMCVEKWREAILRVIAGLRPTPAAPQGSLLANLSTTRSVVGQLLQGASRMSSEYLVSSEMQQLYPSLADAVNEQLHTQLWAPLTEALESCAAECQRAVKRTIIEPVVAKADGYELQLFWSSKQNSGDPFSSAMPTVSYTPAQIAPSELVRSLGEAIVEIPLALEALRGSGDGDCRPNGIEDLLEEVAGDWLEDIVRAAVAEFIENKVGSITIYFPSDAPGAMKKETAAVEQLATDLNYLKSILSAVSGDPFDGLEQALARLKAVALPSGKPIAIRPLLAKDA